jgi:hypothetical protein
MSYLKVTANVIGTPTADLVQGVAELLQQQDGVGIEILGGVIDTRDGDDTITGTSNYGNPGIGISNSGDIIAGAGNDTITGKGTGTSVYRGALPGIGILNSDTIIAGTGIDSITGIGTGSSARGISNRGWISGEADDDAITGIGNGFGPGGEGTGISNSGGIGGGTGADSISGIGTGSLNIYGRGGYGTGISNTGWIGGEEGNDLIIGTGTGDRGGTYTYLSIGTGKGGNGIGISNSSTINAGTGDDLITGIGKGGMGSFLSEGGNAVGISNSSYMSGDNGNDTITGIGLGGRGDSAPDGRGVGIYNTGRLDAGNDKDQILGYGTTVGIEGNGLQSIGIDGGTDNDYFKARKVNGFDTQGNLIESANQDGAIANIFISGGNGNDIFEVGFGSAKLDGGEGYDTLILPTLGSGTYTIGAQNAGWFEITNTASLNVLSVSNIEHIISNGVTLV